MLCGKIKSIGDADHCCHVFDIQFCFMSWLMEAPNKLLEFASFSHLSSKQPQCALGYTLLHIRVFVHCVPIQGTSI